MLMLKYKTEDAYRVSRHREPDGSRETANIEFPRARASSGGSESSQCCSYARSRWGALLLLFVLVAANRMVWDASPSPGEGMSRGNDVVVSYGAGWLEDLIDALNEGIEELEDPETDPDDPDAEPAPSEEQVATVRVELQQDVDTLQAEGIYTEDHPDISAAELEELLSFMHDLADFLYDYTSGSMSNSDKSVN